LEDEGFEISFSPFDEIEEENTPPPSTWHLPPLNEGEEEEEEIQQSYIPPSGIPRTESEGTENKPILIEDSGSESETNPFSQNSDLISEEDHMEEQSENHVNDLSFDTEASRSKVPNQALHDENNVNSSNSEMNYAQFTEKIYKESKKVKKLLKRKFKHSRKHPRSRPSLRSITKIYEISNKMSEIMEILKN